MRYFVLCRSEETGILPYIVAEVLHEALERDDQREASLAATVAGANSTIATREELMRHPDTRAALRDWEQRDDSEFDRETVILNAATEHIGTIVIPFPQGGRSAAKRGK